MRHDEYVGSFARPRSRAVRLDHGVEIGVGDSTPYSLDDRASRRDDIGLGDTGDAPGDRGATFIGVDDGPVTAVVEEELANGLRFFVVDDADDPTVTEFAMLLVERDEFRVFDPAGYTPRGVEVDDDPLIGFGDVERFTEDQLTVDGWGGPAFDLSRFACPGSRWSGGEQHDEQGDQ